MKFNREIREKIKKDKKLIKFMDKRHYKKRSRLLAIARFQYYYHVTGLLPTEAIEEAGQEEDERIPLRRSKLVDHLDDFDDFLEKNYAHRTRQQSMNTIRSFYRRYRITLPEAERLVTNEPRVNLTVQDLPSVDDVKRALSIANVRDSAIIILQVSSGMGRAEVIELTLQDLVEAINRKNEVELTVQDLPGLWENRPEWVQKAYPLVWYVQRIKTSKHYFTFSSTESLEAILDYLLHHPPDELDCQTPLFRTFPHNWRMKPTRLGEVYAHYNNECGFGKAKDGFSYFRSHNMRKLCGNLLKSKIGYMNADKILGHGDRDRTRGDYLKPDIEDLYTLYLKNMDQVTITKKVTIKTSDKEEIDAMKKEREKDRLELEEERRKRKVLEEKYLEDLAKREALDKRVKRLERVAKDEEKI